MKYVFFIPDGVGDYPIPKLGNQTVLEYAKIPNLNSAAQKGFVGLLQTVPQGMDPGSDVAGLSLMGFDPRRYYTGRAPLEAASMGVKLKPNEVAFRANTVTITDGKMADYSGGHPASEKSAKFIRALHEKVKDLGVALYPGIMYRHLLVVAEEKLQEGAGELVLTPPHNITGKKIDDHLPQGRGSKLIREIQNRATELVTSGAFKEDGFQANSVWIWGGGKAPSLPTFRATYGVNAALISAVDLLRGLATYLGMEVIRVPGATGYYDTNYAGKAQYALEALKRNDLVIIHVEATDEAGHNGHLEEKIKAIENCDRIIVKEVLKELPSYKEWRFLVSPDHYTPVAQRNHVAEPVPFALCGTGINSNHARGYNEKEASRLNKAPQVGHELMKEFIKG